MSTLVLLRHGESAWNAEGLFTGWVDVGLSDAGAREAVAGGALLREHGLKPSVVHTSVLTRAIQTANLALEEAGLLWLPVKRSWRLNERHYGALQGKAGVRRGAVHAVAPLLRRAAAADRRRRPVLPGRRRQVRGPAAGGQAADGVPQDVMVRMLPYWYDAVVPDLGQDGTVLVVAHGNSLRALVKHLDGISDDDIAALNIPTGIPLVYQLDDAFRPVTKGG